jgi:IclR family mhp operon transcriptional activator
MPVFDPVTAVVRGLDVLRLVNQLERASITDIHRRSGIPKPTVLRMVETLVSAGYLARVEGTATYTPTGRCLLLSNGYQAHARLTSVIGPHLSAFRKKVGWPSDLGIFDEDAMVIAATNREFGVLSLNRKVGARTPMFLSALGRAYLAFCDEAEQDRIRELLARSSNPLDTVAKNGAAVRRVLRETRARGYSLTDREYLDTVYEGAIWGIGVPVLAGGRSVAAMNVMFLRNALGLEQGIAALVPTLQKVACDIGSVIERDSFDSFMLS